jgi:hypothetical protein
LKSFDNSLDISAYIGENNTNMSAPNISNAPTASNPNNIPVLQTNAFKGDVPMPSSMNSNGLLGIHQNVANMSAPNISNVPTASNPNNIPVLQPNAFEGDVPMPSSMNSNGLLGDISLPNTISLNDYFHSNQPVSENSIAGKKRKIDCLMLSTSPFSDNNGFVSSFLTIDTPESLKTSQRTISTQQMKEDTPYSNRPLSPYYDDYTPVMQPVGSETPNTDTEATPRKNLFGNASPICSPNSRTTEFVRMHDGRRNSTPLPRCVNAPPKLCPKQRKDHI